MSADWAPSLPVETRFAHTGDGWSLALHHYRPRRQRGARPVVLCPGIACNGRFFDAGGGRGLAPYLARKGYDVWVLDPRGRGESKRKKQGLSTSWHFDDYVLKDLPAALQLVLEVSGCPRADWIGHSMGGMVAYAYAMRGLEPGLARLIAVGSPTFHANSFWGWRMADTLSGLLTVVPHLPLRRLSPLAARTMRTLARTLPVPFYNCRNMDKHAVEHLFARVFDDISGTELRQGLRFIRNQGFRSTSGPLKYAECFGRIRIPSLILAGSIDRLAPPEDVQRAYEGLGTEQRSFHCFGTESGCEEEYGHSDLLLGPRADSEVFPLIHAWLSTAEPAPLPSPRAAAAVRR